MGLGQSWERRVLFVCGAYSVLFPGLVAFVKSSSPQSDVLVLLVFLQLVSAIALMMAGMNHVNAVDQSEEVRNNPGAAVPLFIQRMIYFAFSAYAGVSGLVASGLMAA